MKRRVLYELQYFMRYTVLLLLSETTENEQEKIDAPIDLPEAIPQNARTSVM